MNTTERTRTYQWSDPLEGAEKAKRMAGMEYLRAMNNNEIPLPPLLHALGFGKPEIKKAR